MHEKKWLIGILVLLVLAIGFFTLQYSRTSDWFVEYPLPLEETHRLFDIGVVDANGDDLLDIYTSNHHFRQSLLISDGQGDYRDILSAWGLDQSQNFPLAELSFTAPVIDKPGLYIYWLGTDFVIRSHKSAEFGHSWHGVLRVNDPVKIMKSESFQIRKQDQSSPVSETVIEFSSSGDGKLVMRPGGQGLPISFQLEGTASPLSHVYVGRGRVSPNSRNFSLTMRDRHGMAWADYNDDGHLDIFITRGALGGKLRSYPETIVHEIKDELLVSQGPGIFVDAVSQVGIDKNGCSGRHTRWLDFNQDGRLDLFINCYDRKHINGEYPKQLYQQNERGLFQDVAVAAGIGIPLQQIGSFAWIDAEGDGDIDLVTFQDEGFFLYRNNSGHFSQESIHRRSLSGAEKIGNTKGDQWFFDGKMTVSDYDMDGDLDIFSASKRGNVLLLNQKGKYTLVEPTSVGLPEKSTTADWVDYDNDGFPDLYTIPQGLFRQNKDHNFSATGILSFPADQYQAAIANWLDLDNDGRPDLLLAVHENPSFKHWWEFSPNKRHHSTWLVKAFRNVRAENHWLQVKVTGGKGNRQGIGARVTVVTPDGAQVQEVGSTDGAFFSQGHYRLYFGLGDHKKATAVKIRWADGYEQEIKAVTGDKLLVVERNEISFAN